MLSRLRIRTGFAVVLCLFLSSPLLAQTPSDDAEGKSWVMHYIITGILIAVGVIVVGQGSNREINEARKKEAQEAKAKEERLKRLEQG